MSSTHVYSGLVALQANSKDEDRAIVTGSRNVLRSLGGVAGIAVSTAISYAVTDTALQRSVPSSLRESVLNGTWNLGDVGTEAFQSDILEARMKGYRAVFIMQVPLMALCLLVSLFVADMALKDDAERRHGAPKPNDQERQVASSALMQR